MADVLDVEEEAFEEEAEVKAHNPEVQLIISFLMLHLTLKIARGVWEYRRGKKFECPWMPKGPRHKLIRRRSKMILLRRGKVLTRAKSQKFLICSIDIIWQKLKLKYNKINNTIRYKVPSYFS